MQRSTISQRQRPIEASLRNRLLVWRFLKKIENEPVISTDTCEQQMNSTDPSNSSWLLGLNENCDVEEEIDMDIDSDLVTVVNHETDSTNSSCDNMDIEQETDVTLLLKRAIGAERRQKSSTEINNNNTNEIDNNNNLNNNNNTEQTTNFEETEQFFHDLCAELTNTTAALVSSTTTNSLRCPTPPEQTLIH